MLDNFGAGLGYMMFPFSSLGTPQFTLFSVLTTSGREEI